jgi:hypothetical protein
MEIQTAFPLAERTQSETSGLYDHLHPVLQESLHGRNAYEQ